MTRQDGVLERHLHNSVAVSVSLENEAVSCVCGGAITEHVHPMQCVVTHSNFEPGHPLVGVSTTLDQDAVHQELRSHVRLKMTSCHLKNKCMLQFVSFLRAYTCLLEETIRRIASTFHTL